MFRMQNTGNCARPLAGLPHRATLYDENHPQSHCARQLSGIHTRLRVPVVLQTWFTAYPKGAFPWLPLEGAVERMRG